MGLSERKSLEREGGVEWSGVEWNEVEWSGGAEGRYFLPM